LTHIARVNVPCVVGVEKVRFAYAEFGVLNLSDLLI
jgi:hypothetical protein